MADTAQQKASHGDVDHGFGDVDALFVVAHKATPLCEPAEGSFNDPSSWQRLEAGLGVNTAHHLDDEIEEGGLVHQLPAVVGAIGEQMLDPRPSLSGRIEDHLRLGTVGNVGQGKVDHQQAPIGVDHNVPLTPNSLLGGVIALLGTGCGRLDSLAVDDAGTRAGFAPDPLAIEHQGDVMDGAEQHQPHEASEPPVDRLPGCETLRQHPPATRTRHVADRVENLPQVKAWLAPAFGRLRQQRNCRLAFLVGEIGRVALRLPLDRGHPVSHVHIDSVNHEPETKET